METIREMCVLYGPREHDVIKLGHCAFFLFSYKLVIVGANAISRNTVMLALVAL